MKVSVTLEYFFNEHHSDSCMLLHPRDHDSNGEVHDSFI